jgi:hypothetical protein
MNLYKYVTSYSPEKCIKIMSEFGDYKEIDNKSLNEIVNFRVDTMDEKCKKYIDE